MCSHCSLFTAALNMDAASCQLLPYLPASTSVSQLSADCCASSSGFCATAAVARNDTSIAIPAKSLGMVLMPSTRPSLHHLSSRLTACTEHLLGFYTTGQSALRLQLREQLLDAVFLFERLQPVFDIVRQQFGLRLSDRFLVREFALHAIERVCLGASRGLELCVGCPVSHSRAAMLRDEQVRLRVRLGKFLFQFAQGR